MAKISIMLVLVTLAVAIQGAPAPLDFDELVNAAKTGDWDQFQQLVNTNFASSKDFKPVSFANVRNLKPLDGGHVFGEAEYTFHTATNLNGQTSEESGGHKVINNDGTIKEFDFKP